LEKIIQIEIGIAIEIESCERKTELDRMAAMLSRLGKRGYSVQEESVGYGVDLLRHLHLRYVDSDSDLLAPSPLRSVDPDETKSQPDAALNADKPRE
jgi:hypothetical protein